MTGTLDLGSLRAAINALPTLPPCPLNGATLLIANPDSLENARKLAEAYNEHASAFGRRVTARASAHVPRLTILGFDGDGVVVLRVGPDGGANA